MAAANISLENEVAFAPDARANRRIAASVPEAKPADAPSGKKRRVWLIAAIAGLGAIAGVGAYLHYSARFEETDNAFVEADVHPISSRVAGEVIEVVVQDNERVAQGQVLARLDPRDFEIQVQAAKAELEQANVQILQSDAARAQAEAELRRADAQATSNQAQAERATNDFHRSEQLLSAKITTKQEYDSAKAGMTSATAARAAAEAGREAAAAALRTAEANQKAAQAKKQLVETELAKAELQLSYTTLLAPSAGTVARKTVQTGQHVQPGQPLLAVVAPETWLVANFKENQLAPMKVGQPVEITVDALHGERFHGHVESFAPGTGAKFSLLPPDNATGNFTKVVQRVPVKIVLDANAPDLARLAPGLSAIAKVRIKE